MHFNLSPSVDLVYVGHPLGSVYFFFFNDTATTEIYTLSLHDALPISFRSAMNRSTSSHIAFTMSFSGTLRRSEEHTSELQSQSNLVCRLLLEKKKKKNQIIGLPVSVIITCVHAALHLRPSICGCLAVR